MNRRAALWLGATSTADYVAQLLLPALLVRTLTPADFGGYRILWMTAQTAVLVLSLNMALNLIYLAPKQPRERRGAVLGTVLAYLLLAGLLAAWLAGPVLRAVAGTDVDQLLPPWALPLFVCAWMVSLPFDQIALVAGQPRTQAWLTLGQTGTRIALLGGAAWFTRSLSGLAIGMIALAALRLLTVLVFARASGAFPALRVETRMAASQIRYGIGFGLGASLFALRGQVDAWIAAALFDPVAVATVSIALAIVPVIGVIRQAFTNANVSEVARLIAAHQTQAALQINRDANLSTALLVLPLIGAFIAVAPDAIALVYTPAYAAAALPAQLYAAAYAICVLEMSSVVQAMGDGRFVMRTGALMLVCGTACAILGAHFWGLPGIALGTLFAMWLGSALNIHHVMVRSERSLASLQAWSDMGWLMGLAAISTLASGLLLAHFSGGHHLQRVLLGACVFAAVQAALAISVPPVRLMYVRHWQARVARQTPQAPSHS